MSGAYQSANLTFPPYLQIMNINESPVFLLMDTDMSRRHKDLPVSLYESGALSLPTIISATSPASPQHGILHLLHAELRAVEGTSQTVFVQSKYTVEVRGAPSSQLPKS